MAVYSLKTVQQMPISVQEAWHFFSNPANLELLTDKKLHLKIISQHHGERMYAGQIIEYRLKPLLGISMYWMTEITHMEENVFFVDEQRFGPYSFWHHQHHFREIPGGVEMTDIVHYKNPFRLLGDLANTMFVRRQLEGIFSDRYTLITKRFGEFGLIPESV